MRLLLKGAHHVFIKNITARKSRTLLASLITSLIASLSLISVTLFIAPSAHAEKGYRYWGYFQAPAGKTSWTAAMTGPTVELHDGDVEGWTFTASSNDIPATAPMADPDFATLCGGTSSVAGKIRVGIVVDFGTADIAPTGETPKEVITDCVTIPAKSNGLVALQAVAQVRADKSGLICGIGGYPAKECGVEIDMPATQSQTTSGQSAAPLTTSEDSGEKSHSEIREGFEPSEYIAIGFALVAAIGIFFIIRRRK